jgi:hypothetical protein
VVETGGLENRCTGNGTGGSNPSPSATRCGMPNERDKKSSTQPYLSVGYPNSGVICGRTSCRNPAFAGLTLDEEKEYRDEGERISLDGYRSLEDCHSVSNLANVPQMRRSA